MKKILFFIDSFTYGGAEKVLVNLLNRLDRNKYDITVETVFGDGVNQQYLNPDIKYKWIFKKTFRGNIDIFKMFTPQYLYKKYVTEKYDIIIAYLEGKSTRILSGCPDEEIKKVAWIHREMSEKTRFYPYRSKNECIECYRKFTKIVGVAQEVLDSFVSQTGSWDNLCVKYNTIDSDYIRERCQESIEEDFPAGIRNVVAVGRLEEQKSFGRLLRIHKRLIDKGVVYNLYIIGEGKQRRQLQQFIDQNGLKNTARLLGYKENPWAYIAKADLFVCSSWGEGFSTAVTEALIVGTPVVTTMCSGMKELLGDNNEYGVITKNDEDALAHGIERLLTNNKELNHYAEMAAERGRIFEAAPTVKAVEDMLDSL